MELYKARIYAKTNGLRELFNRDTSTDAEHSYQGKLPKVWYNLFMDITKLLVRHNFINFALQETHEKTMGVKLHIIHMIINKTFGRSKPYEIISYYDFNHTNIAGMTFSPFKNKISKATIIYALADLREHDFLREFTIGKKTQILYSINLKKILGIISEKWGNFVDEVVETKCDKLSDYKYMAGIKDKVYKNRRLPILTDIIDNLSRSKEQPYPHDEFMSRAGSVYEKAFIKLYEHNKEIAIAEEYGVLRK